MNLFANAMPLSTPASTVPDEDAKMIRLTRAGVAASAVGAAAYFTGAVNIDALFQGAAPARVGGASVSFEPGARTVWHTHPLSQTLIVTAGVGRVQEWGKPVQEIHPGDVVWIPPGVKHWHGASAQVAMTHIAITEAVDGSLVTWLEPVSDSQYRGE
ncbi:(R)-mandelonitrile lyase [Xanthomonas translucens]|uniref:Cupin n=3 Tax=Xanthomonas campestris pv. translucens TaxID=343 RepID=A0A109HIV0_XANCT|nr:cupin domain-containing protein [Xanthomonas translucens]KTF40344.1 cupin [Xanthomonas translucens pv. translucens]KWV13013.1 cupin [Xanthomonas translucens]KWV16611.1 cupin [Xanthomonas translucens]MCC8447988.1 cupin domain-containing protein [Xanthomonas translucens pv. translucens]MCS3361130.1 cupin domain-containing protein [Xanthomonas translucens pv. translucens]